jgi:hypothetical protein
LAAVHHGVSYSATTSAASSQNAAAVESSGEMDTTSFSSSYRVLRKMDTTSFSSFSSSHGVDRREDGGERGHHVLLELVQGVEDEGLGAGGALHLLERGGHHDVVGVRGAAECRHVPKPHVAHPRHPLQRRVQVPVVGEEARVFERDEASSDELAVLQIPHESACGGREELHLGDAGLPGGGGREGHDDLDHDAGEGRRALLLRLLPQPPQQRAERFEAVALAGRGLAAQETRLGVRVGRSSPWPPR